MLGNEKKNIEGRRRRQGAPKNSLLIFDQFEEVLRVDPLDVAGKREFFDQLGELLHDPRVWALFILREDYLAALDPYCRQLPTHLKNRYRIDRLGVEAAAQAIEKPTQNTPRKFAEGVVEQLVKDLARVNVQQPDGSVIEQSGLHVEPLQLQVVCYGLWERMEPDDLSIDPEDVEQFGDVSEALANYYETSIRTIAKNSETVERQIRDWFQDKLITADGVRSQVLRGAEQSDGLANELISRLLDTYLVRAEQRAGATWYELAHDRLVEPVRSNNKTWQDENLNTFQRQAALWEKQARPEGLLLQDQALTEAETWAETNKEKLTDSERAFLEKCRNARTATEQKQRQTRWIRRLAIGATIGLIGAVILSGICLFADE